MTTLQRAARVAAAGAGEELAVAVDHGRMPWQPRMDQPPLVGGLEHEDDPSKRGKNDSQGRRLYLGNPWLPDGPLLP